jgi:hypothetical protein
MSSSPTDPTSTTGSSTSWPSRADRIALVACGAIAQPAAEACARHTWPVDVHPLNPLLHNHPERIAGAVADLADKLTSRYAAVAVGYADCGTYGALDDLCAERGWVRLEGLHCYDLYAGPDRVAELLAAEPGTYLLTDFLVKSFSRTVIHELGLDRYPELRDDYFRHYARMVWLAQDPDDAELRALAQEAAARVELPLEIVATGWSGLERALARLVARHSGVAGVLG